MDTNRVERALREFYYPLIRERMERNEYNTCFFGLVDKGDLTINLDEIEEREEILRRLDLYATRKGWEISRGPEIIHDVEVMNLTWRKK